MKALQDVASMLFIVAVEILAIVSVLGIWEVFKGDVIEKSVATLGLLAFVSVIVLVASRFIESRSAHDPQTPPELPNPLFKTVRQITLALLIGCAALLALLGVLAIWEVVADRDVLYKSLATLGALAFSAFVIVMACLEREKFAFFSAERKGWSIGGVIGIFFLLWILSSLFGMFGRFF